MSVPPHRSLPDGFVNTARHTDELSAHRSFLNRYYGWSRRIYDVTRKYYLFGRDTALQRLAEEPWESLVEVGPGTGRNLRKLHGMRPRAALGGIDASDAMLEHARVRCPWATFEHGFAEDVDYASVLRRPPERILFSYCLSMVTDPVAALEGARRGVAPGGEVWVVDFSDLEGLPAPAARALRGWLRTFHVEPVDHGQLEAVDARIEHGPMRYWVLARIRAA